MVGQRHGARVSDRRFDALVADFVGEVGLRLGAGVLPDHDQCGTIVEVLR